MESKDDLIKLVSLKKKLMDDGKLNIRIVSDSMYPCLKIGDQIEVAPLTRPLKTFDIIVYLSENRFICHYVWKNQIDFDNTIVTRSIKNSNSDEIPLPFSNILGQVNERRISLLLRFTILLRNLLKNSI